MFVIIWKPTLDFTVKVSISELFLYRRQAIFDASPLTHCLYLLRLKFRRLLTLPPRDKFVGLLAPIKSKLTGKNNINNKILIAATRPIGGGRHWDRSLAYRMQPNGLPMIAVIAWHVEHGRVLHW